MASYEKVQEYYERGLKAAREGRFMASDHFFQRAVAQAYSLHGVEGKIQSARHIARIYREQGLPRMALHHYGRALQMLERAGARESDLYQQLSRNVKELSSVNLDRLLYGLGIVTEVGGPVPTVEACAPLVLKEVRALVKGGVPTDKECAEVAKRLNKSGVPTGKGQSWTMRHIRDLCNAGLS